MIFARTGRPRQRIRKTPLPDPHPAPYRHANNFQVAELKTMPFSKTGTGSADQNRVETGVKGDGNTGIPT